MVLISYLQFIRMANFLLKDEKSDFNNQNTEGSRFAAYVASLFDPGLTWNDIIWLKRYSLIKARNINENINELDV